MKKNIRYKRFKFLLKKNTNDNIPAIAAQSAFFMLLSIVPSLMFTFAILSFFNIPREMFDTYLKSALTNEFALYFKSFIETAYDNSVGIAFTTIILALWSAGKGIYSITEGINRIYRIKSRNFWFVKRLYAMGYTLIMFIVMFIATGVLVVSGIFDEIIKPHIENLPYVIELLYTLRYFVAFVVIVLLMSLALKFYLWHK
ncbi:MAG: YihY/virulence factor BrkB family protein, partial [Ruminococcus sp.]|nr:YihY/virulence factor BrkB family protein [Ruminococcus sp.]